MKEILTNKKKLEDLRTFMLNDECSAILQNNLPPKLKDPRSFTILNTIGDMEFDKVLCDLDACIYLMPYFIFRRLDLGEAKVASISLQLANRSIKFPKEINEEILEDKDVPLILERSFLAISQALINVEKGKLMLRLNDG
ncbi:uncharacterized protein LOC111378490 [Olea europaea var. sylvestris]|uniref:uncharacterized protein LOC111378490 n=1 Tax=Olea europaea var. sylvestris TaxID=158386 RepID=UPI000C1CDE40|nr:uncharacterized protein LOC111378490 [Olea europaea var. sylvestris]